MDLSAALPSCSDEQAAVLTEGHIKQPLALCPQQPAYCCALSPHLLHELMKSLEQLGNTAGCCVVFFGGKDKNPNEECKQNRDSERSRLPLCVWQQNTSCNVAGSPPFSQTA